MRGTWGVAAVLIGAAACGNGRAAPIRSPAEIGEDYRERLEQVNREAQGRIYWVKCDDAPAVRAGCGLLVPELVSTPNVVAFLRDVCKGDDQPSSACEGAFDRMVMGRILRRYSLASETSIDEACRPRGGCTNLLLIELVAMRIHNDVVYAAADARMADVLASHERAQKEAAMARESRARAAEEDARIAAAIQAVAAGMRERVSASPRREPSAQSPPPTDRNASSCSSDYDCGFGNFCVKPELSFNGTCARAVNQFGNPTFTPPRPDSVGPGHGDCAFDTDCSIGFKCVKGAALKGHCMR